MQHAELQGVRLHLVAGKRLDDLAGSGRRRAWWRCWRGRAKACTSTMCSIP